MHAAMRHECQSCTQPTNTILCRSCVDRLVRALRDLAYDVNRDGRRRPGLISDLMDARYKRDNITSGGGSTSTVPPLPFNPAAADLLTVVRSVLTARLRDFEAVSRLDCPVTGAAACAEWIAGHRTHLAGYVHGADMLAEITALVREVRHAVDRAPDRIYLGVCTTLLDDGTVCPAGLYGAPEHATVVCRACRTVHDAHERWLDIQDRVRGSLATAAEISGAIASLYGRQVNVKTIRTWAIRGVIETYGTNSVGVSMHHVGEVFAVAARPRRAALREAS